MSKPIQRMEPGPRLSEAVVYDGTVYLSGMVAEAAAGGSVAAQTKDILGQIEQVLAQVGSNKTKLLKVNIWLSDITTIGEMNAVWDAWVVPGHTPVRATVEANLASPDWAVEIMVEAVV
jgi:enamine deaminase RidA (YjgF/YER057c/UK114 family)